MRCDGNGSCCDYSCSVTVARLALAQLNESSSVRSRVESESESESDELGAATCGVRGRGRGLGRAVRREEDPRGECRMPNAECRMRNAEWGSSKLRLPRSRRNAIPAPRSTRLRVRVRASSNPSHLQLQGSASWKVEEMSENSDQHIHTDTYNGASTQPTVEADGEKLAALLRPIPFHPIPFLPLPGLPPSILFDLLLLSSAPHLT